jgi:hypothetical protein
MNSDAPIACSLDAAELRTRLEELAALGRDALVRVDQDGTMHFRADSATRQRLEAVIEAESRCCPFLSFDLRDDGETIALTVVAPEGAEPVVTELTAALLR